MNLLEKSIAALALTLLVFGGGVYVGRENAEPKIVYKTLETRTEDLSRFELVKPEVITKVVQGPTVIKRVVIIKAPDGTIITDTTDTKNDPITTDVLAKAESVRVEIQTITVTKEVIKWKTLEAPRWSAQLLTGLDSDARMQLGGNVSYRFAGPFTLGGYGLKSSEKGPLQGGLSAGFTF